MHLHPPIFLEVILQERVNRRECYRLATSNLLDYPSLFQFRKILARLLGTQTQEIRKKSRGRIFEHSKLRLLHRIRQQEYCEKRQRRRGFCSMVFFGEMNAMLSGLRERIWLCRNS